MSHVRRITVFLASPGDVSAERDHVRSVVAELNRTLAAKNGFHLDVVGWDTNARPAFGKDGQAIINEQIADMSGHDLFVGIMWNRFGSPTPRAGSGTEEEFELALQSMRERGKPQIMLYFGQMPASLESADQLGQKAKVVEFKSRVEKEGLTWRYASPEAFRDLFREHLTGWLLSIPSPQPPEATHAPMGEAAPAAETVAPGRPSPVAPAVSGSWVLLGDRFFRAASVRERQGEVAVTVVPEGADDDDALRQAASGRMALRFAYQNQAGAAEVRGGERSSGPDGDRWELTLRLQRHEGSVMGEVTYNGHSPLEMATMRARLILLNEPPRDARDAFLSAMVSGYGNSGKIEAGLLPGLWRSLGRDPELFTVLARLLAVYFLKSTNTVEQIMRLEIGPVENGAARVTFEGLRPKYYSNVDPERIRVEGTCPLE